MSIEGKIFVITGSGRGIGAETARLAASRGAKVVVSDVLDDLGQEVAASIRAGGGSASYVHCDVSQEEDVRSLMKSAAEAFGGIDVLHNNAGIHEVMVSQEVTLESMSLETFDRVLAINLRSIFLCSKHALPWLRQSTRRPSIINAGSTGSWTAYPTNLAYGASKGGVALLTKNLAVELAPLGIRVNCYCPTATETEMLKAAEAADESFFKGLTATNLVHRMGQPIDVARLVCFLASDDADFVDGAVWLVDGGSLAWRGTVDALGMT